jgi:hypothetical protein
LSGVGSLAVDDVRAQLRKLAADLALDLARVPITRPEEVARALGRAMQAQASSSRAAGARAYRRWTTTL